jgi:AcrR family transcriptional regulator
MEHMSRTDDEVGDLRLARGQATRQQLIDAAAAVLHERGYASTSMRAVADQAGLRLSLVHYHFGSKGGLLTAVMDSMTGRLLDRQRQMFTDGRPFSAQWRSACEFLRDDIQSGYVRILWELWAAGLTDTDLAERWRVNQGGWRNLILERLERMADERDIDLPMQPRVLATLVGSLFEGAEVEMLIGVPEQESPHLEALEAIAVLIEQSEQKQSA